MTAFTAYTAETAPEAARPTLGAVKAAFGFVPNLQAHMAESPELLAGYSALWELFSQSTLTLHEQQVVYLTSNFENECHYCMAGQTTRSEEHTSEIQSLMRISYAVFCLKKKNNTNRCHNHHI